MNSAPEPRVPVDRNTGASQARLTHFSVASLSPVPQPFLSALRRREPGGAERRRSELARSETVGTDVGLYGPYRALRCQALRSARANRSAELLLRARSDNSGSIERADSLGARSGKGRCRTDHLICAAPYRLGFAAVCRSRGDRGCAAPSQSDPPRLTRGSSIACASVQECHLNPNGRCDSALPIDRLTISDRWLPYTLDKGSLRFARPRRHGDANEFQFSG